MKNKIETVWRDQRSKLQILAKREGLPPLGQRGDLSAALSFAEMLSLAADEASTSKLFAEDRQGALSFLEILGDMDDAFAGAVHQPSLANLKGAFHELADFVSDFLGGLKDIAPDEFS